jgi:hypothetical protein
MAQRNQVHEKPWLRETRAQRKQGSQKTGLTENRAQRNQGSEKPGVREAIALREAKALTEKPHTSASSGGLHHHLFGVYRYNSNSVSRS